MKKFKYRLEPLLKVKKHIENEKKKQLALAARKVVNQKENLENIKMSKNHIISRQRNKSKQSFKVAEMLVISRYIHKLKRDDMMNREILRVLEQDEHKKRQILFKASIERKKYEKLKEKQGEKHRKQFEDKLTKEIDEIAINNYRFKNNK